MKKHLTIEGYKNILIFFVIFLFFQGPWVYVASPTFSFANLVSFTLFPVLILLSIKRHFTLPSLILTIALTIFLSASFYAYFVVDNSYENARIIRASVLTTSVLFWSAYLYKNNKVVFISAIKFSYIFFFAIALLQILYVSTGYGVDPSINYKKIEGIDIEQTFSFGFPSIFTNPNDYSALSVLFLLFLLTEKENKSKKLLFTITLLSIFISGSKTAIILAFLSILFFLKFKKHVVILFSALLFISYSGFNYTDFYSINRLHNLLTQLTSGDWEDTSSLGLRVSSLKYFILNYTDFLSGSFAYGKPYPQFLDSEYNSTIIPINPHNYIIEMHALFGFIGFIILALTIISAMLYLRKSKSKPKVIFLLFAIMLISNISSSVINFTLYFLFSMIVLLAYKHSYSNTYR